MSDRRRDRNQWWRVTEYMEKGDRHEVMGVDVYVRGHIGDLVVVQTPNMEADEQHRFLGGLRKFLEQAGISDNSLIVPRSVEFVRFEAVDGSKAKELEGKRAEGTIGPQGEVKH